MDLEHPTHALSIAVVQLIEAACHAQDGDRDAVQGHIARALALLDGQPSVPSQRPRPSLPVIPPSRRIGLATWQLRRLAAHVEVHLSRRISIDELASLLGLSKSHFCRVFKSSVGLTAHMWLMQRRIELAQALMLTTNATLSQIALSCGMCDQSHFTRSFRRLSGETPRSWRRNRRSVLAIDLRTTRGAGT